MKKSLTLGEGASFAYEEKNTLVYGTTNTVTEKFTLKKLQELLDHFRQQEQPILIAPAHKNSEDLPEGSLGHWVTINIDKTNLASYIAAILVENKFATYEHIGSAGAIKFL